MNTRINMQDVLTQKKMAVSGRINTLAAIVGADRIQLATVDCGDAGCWSGVVGIDIQQAAPVTVFLQDALLPPNPRWQFMERHQWRVRMARFKKVASECVIIPGDDLPPGTDLTESLGVTKYEKPIPASLAGDMVGAFPCVVPKTDETNFQAAPELVERMAVDPWYATEKADGSSCTVWNDDAGMHVCSRNWELREFTASGAGNVYWQAARQYGLDALPTGMALQFEVVGPSVQGNPMGLPMREARAFTLRDTARHMDLPMLALAQMCGQLGIPKAMTTEIGTGFRTPDQLRAMAQIRYANGKPGEGIVIRAMDSSWSFKVINLDYKD